MKGIMKYAENKWACQQQVPWSSMKLNIKMETAMMSDCPASTPLIPAKILIAFVQNIANIPI